MTGAFGSVYCGNQGVQDRLGPPQAAESTIDAAELSFQRGSMYEWLSKKTVYVFFSDGTWTPVQVSTPGAGGAGSPVQDSSNLWIPPAGFNEAWNSVPSIQPEMGYAVSAQARTMEGRFQSFANGAMLYSDRGFVYVIFHDGHWELYPDTSGHGDLITPTPEPDPSATRIRNHRRVRPRIHPRTRRHHRGIARDPARPQPIPLSLQRHRALFRTTLS